jgi:hypothetical protein
MKEIYSSLLTFHPTSEVIHPLGVAGLVHELIRQEGRGQGGRRGHGFFSNLTLGLFEKF